MILFLITSIIYENYICSTNFIEINLKNYLEFSKLFFLNRINCTNGKAYLIHDDSYFEKRACYF